MGHGSEAKKSFNLGLETSISLSFPLPIRIFSIHLDRLFARGITSTTMVRDLEDVDNILNDTNELWVAGCIKCNSMIKSSVDGELGFTSKSSRGQSKLPFSHGKIKQSLIPKSPISKYSKLGNWISFKWGCVRRQMTIELLTEALERSFSQEMAIRKKIILKYISLLVGENSWNQTYESIDINFFEKFVEFEIPGDMFAIQQAEIIHTVCWNVLRYYKSSEFGRYFFGDLFSMDFGKLVSYLKLAFVLSRGVPLILQKCGLYGITLGIHALREDSHAIVMLMGCLTAQFKLQGRYNPYPYSYLLTYCPAIIGNMWVVTNLEIDREALYKAWLKEISDNTGRDKRGIMAFMLHARKSLTLSLMTGGSIICYGVPTTICNKDTLLLLQSRSDNES